MTYLGIHCNLKTFKHFSKIPNVAINARGDVCVSWKEWSNYKQENQHGVVNNIYDFGRLWSYFERLRCYLGRLEFIGNLYRVFFSNLFLVICIFCTSINICILFGKKYYLCFTYLVIKLRTPLHLKKNKKNPPNKPWAYFILRLHQCYHVGIVTGLYTVISQLITRRKL